MHVGPENRPAARGDARESVRTLWRILARVTWPLTTRRTVLAIVAVFLVTGLARSLAMMAVAGSVGADLGSEDPALRHDGLLIGAGVLGGATAGLAVLLASVPRSVLGVERAAPRAVALWLGVALLQVAIVDAGAWATGRPLVEAAWVDAYHTAPVALLALALTVTSIFEELYFRGLLQGALAQTRLGTPGAIVVTALLFALAHFPSDLWRFADVLSAGLLLGVARQRSGSTLVTMVPHVLGNLKVLVVLAIVA